MNCPTCGKKCDLLWDEPTGREWYCTLCKKPYDKAYMKEGTNEEDDETNLD